MSLILDALRKSAGERQRGHAPTLASSVGLTPRRRAHPARVPVALALLAGTAGAGWWLGLGESSVPTDLADRGEPTGPGGATPVLAVTDATMEQGLASAPALADEAPELRPEAVQLPLDDVAPQMGEAQSRMAGGVVAGSGAAALPLPAGTVYTPEAMAAATEPTPAAPTPAIAVPEPSAVAAVEPASAVSSISSAVPATAVTAPPPTPAPVESLITIDQLDYSIRRELPALDVSMYVYHADPARRFVIIGGKRYPRSDATGAQITKIEEKVDLLEIRGDGAVLEFNGQRFLLPRSR
jgi:general secretion pathway protein B